MVKSFVMEAIPSGVLASFSYKILPVLASTAIACSAVASKSCAKAELVANPKQSKTDRKIAFKAKENRVFFIHTLYHRNQKKKKDFLT